MKITIFGAGYVGLSLAMLLDMHNDVVVVDINKQIVDSINNRLSPIRDNLIESYLKNTKCRVRAVLLNDYLLNAELCIVATPTNYDSNTGSFDTSSVESIIQLIINNGPIPIVIKSTIPLHFTRSMIKKYSYKQIYFSPEFLREGKALEDNLNPSRIVIGINDKSSLKQIEFAKLFLNLLSKHLKSNDINSHIVGLEEAEAIKLFANTYLATRVAFFNELDTYCEVNSLDSKEIIEGVCDDKRIGNYYNNPSFGYGGYCLPKDTKQLSKNFGNIPNKIISSTVEANNVRKNHIVSQIEKKMVNKNIKSIGVFKLAMKYGSDNYRSSSMLGIIERLTKKCIEVLIYDPSLKEKVFLNCEVVSSIAELNSRCGLIITNRIEKELLEFVEIKKIYTRDLFNDN